MFTQYGVAKVVPLPQFVEMSNRYLSATSAGVTESCSCIFPLSTMGRLRFTERQGSRCGRHIWWIIVRDKHSAGIGAEPGNQFSGARHPADDSGVQPRQPSIGAGPDGDGDGKVPRLRVDIGHL